MGKFAQNTNVPVEKTKTEIERALQNYGASSFLSGYHEGRAFIQFIANTRHVRFILKLPTLEEFARDSRGARRAQWKQEAALDQERRRRWRALLLVIKAKLEAVQSGISSFEEEFLAHIMLPNGSTVGQFMIPQVEETYKTGHMPQLLPGLPEHKEEGES